MLLVAGWFDLTAELTRDIDLMQTLKPRTLPGRGFSLRDRGVVSFFEGDVPDELQRLDPLWCY
jgi:hypothetical protein